MLNIERVVFPTDFSASSDQAYRHALLLAEAYRAELHLFHAVVLHADDPHNPTHRFPDAERVYRELRETAKTVMLEASAEHEAGEVEVRHVLRRAIAAFPAILGYLEESDADVAVIGTHGRGAIGRALLGSVAREVVRAAPCPVLTVRQHGAGEPLQRIARVAVAVDFSDHSALALDYGRDLADIFGARLQVVHVVEEALYPEFYYPVIASPLTLTGEMREQVEAQLRSWLRDKAAGDVEAELSVLAGRPVAEIAAMAESDRTDLIVISSHGRTGFQRALMGSVAEGVVAHAECPVLTVKPFGKNLLAA